MFIYVFLANVLVHLIYLSQIVKNKTIKYVIKHKSRTLIRVS